MFDCHFDLLMYIYMCKKDISEVKEYCEKVYRKDNITGGVFNFYYTDANSMEQKLGIKRKDFSVHGNVKEVNRLIEKYKIIPEGTEYIIGIEGLDYLKDFDEIDTLYELGLRSTNIVWNNENSFGGGTKARKEIGLTELGIRLVDKLVEKRIAIDLSHANEKTFYGIIEECRRLRQAGKNPIIYASHSNAKAVCNHERNLTDEQIKVIAHEFEGVIGVVEYPPFVKIKGKNENIGNVEYEEHYLNHIKYIKELLGGVEHISVSTDDMTFEHDICYELPIYQHAEVAEKIKGNLLSGGYSKKEAEKILHENFESKILKRL